MTIAIILALGALIVGFINTWSIDRLIKRIERLEQREERSNTP
jgi:uncharacterized membrane protein